MPIFIVVFISVLMDSYVKELHKSEQYLAILEEKNREIEAKNKMLEKSNAEFIKAKEKEERLNKMLSSEKQKLQELSITDYLTGAFNRRFITACLNEELEAAYRREKRLTVAMIDIDNFKMINDTYGHVFGDYVLKRIVETMERNLRQTDIIGRYGGDEFLIIMCNTFLEDGYKVIDRLRRRIWELEWKDQLVITISGGVVEAEDEDITTLLKKAMTKYIRLRRLARI
ncbi:MAG: GGDEF domain-containing protein [Tissierellia bacterium]|nr:GGDEF domain-containing protein [Tissierellia bacterium]